MQPALHSATEARRIPLRERKFAATKLGLMRSAIERMAHKPFSEITVKELCEDVQVSEATFFNYFKKKDDVLRYFVKVWSIEMAWYARQARGLAAVEIIFQKTGKDLAHNVRPMLEIISHMALAADTDCPHANQELCLAERLQAFPQLHAIESVEDHDLRALLRRSLECAIAIGELPGSVDLDAAVEALGSVLFGVPLLFKCEPEGIPAAYRRQLGLIWSGLRATSAA